MSFTSSTPNHSQPIATANFESSSWLIANHNILDRQSALRNSWDDSEREKRIVVGKLMQSRLAQLVLDLV